MDDKDKFIASVIGCPISTVTTYRNKFNEWGRKADEARLSKLKTIQNLCESSLNPESNNDGNPVVKKFLSYIGKAVRDAEGASKKKEIICPQKNTIRRHYLIIRRIFRNDYQANMSCLSI